MSRAGGGFSILESNRRPSYQAKAVEAYIASATMPDGYNKTGRAYRACLSRDACAV